MNYFLEFLPQEIPLNLYNGFVLQTHSLAKTFHVQGLVHLHWFVSAEHTKFEMLGSHKIELEQAALPKPTCLFIFWSFFKV